MDKKESVSLDKYYTKSETALLCYNKLKEYISSQNIYLNNTVFIEPSAGSGRFLDVIQEVKLGFDLYPERSDIFKMDFLSGKIIEYSKSRKCPYIFIGNPPFGYKGRLAIDFINTSLKCGEVVGFILPIQFRKWSAQLKINNQAKLVLDMTLPANSFTLLDKEYNLRCCFQIWTLYNSSINFRILEKPKTEHPDFKLYQYNRTTEAEKYFDMDWDFAVPRQGYLDYTFKAFSKEQCNKKQQWIFFKANNNIVLEKLKSLDFVKLSLKNSGLPGFGKADVIEEYTKLC